MPKDNKSYSVKMVHHVAATTLIIVFFIGVILLYYARLYSETREGIISRGELSATVSAGQIDKHISLGIDAIRIAAYTVDNMIRDGRSQAEILDYLTNQSAAIINIMQDDTTGLYGYINDEYLSGVGWVPGEGYVPTERPWYIAARASIGRVAIVDPYTDALTHTTMITLAKTLCDARSVVALDFSLARLQSITEELAAQSDSDMELILDRKYQVIAHSDPAEVGKNYISEEGTFGAKLVKELRAADKSYFSVKYDDEDYIVYQISVANDWLCLSVFDATEAFAMLRKTLALTIAASMLICAILLTIMEHINRKDRIEQQLTENLSQAQSDIQEKDDQIGRISKVAYRDALTGVGSKAAFNELTKDIERELASGSTGAAVVMMDVNDLKYINDAFGHDAGDDYLRGCCKLICDVFKHSPVFRLGGDEFAAVLRETDFENRQELFAQLTESFRQSQEREDARKWERYSISAGMADFEPGDKLLSQPLKRADDAMYAAKAEHKAKHGSYR